MAKYSVTLQELCKDYYSREEVESWFSDYNLSDFLMPEQIAQIEKYNVWSKEKLANEIVDWYYMREIGFETPELFKHYAKIKMKRIMEGKLLKIYTLFLEYDPLSSVDYTEEYIREIEGTSNSNGSSNSVSNSSGLGINNDTPQTRITKQNLENGAYASSINQSDSKIEDLTTTNNNGISNTIEKYTHSMKGDNGVIVTNEYLVREFRENIVAVNSEVIDELNDLFMGLY